jgi:bacillithiol biosynthesis cysteine-adding enzyme BshC
MPVSSASPEATEKIATIPAQALGASRLYSAFLDGDPAVRAWYPHEWCKIGGAPEGYPGERRARVAAILEDQNRRWDCGDETLRNLERFRAGAAAMVTGQQVGLFGGPLYSVLKALTAIKLAAEQTRKGIDTVPIFWLATEDHDLDEVKFTEVLTREHVLAKISLEIKNDDQRVGDVVLPEQITKLTQELRSMLGESDALAILERCYAPGITFADAFARLFTELFRKYGLILIDNRDARLHSICAPIFMKTAAHAAPLNQALRRRSEELEAAGFHAQVHVDKSSTTLFHLQNGRRVAIKLENGALKAGKKSWTPEQLAKHAERSPEEFSANALLRPVLQDHLLPSSAYIGGPAEVAYFAQSEVLYRELLGRVTPVLPRASVTVIDAGVSRLLKKFGLQPQDCFVRAEELRLKISKKQLPEDMQSSFESASAALEQELSALQNTVSSLDPTLAGAADNATRKMRYQLRRLADRAARAQLRKQSDLDRQCRRLSNSLYPNGTFQERELGSIYFLATHGLQLLDRIFPAIKPPSSDHQFIWL